MTLFFVSREPALDVRSFPRSRAMSALHVAKNVYDDKDVKGDVCFKICGAEVDSSWSSVARGAVVAGSPYEKRMSLAVATSVAATLPVTTDAFMSCLVGSWISAMMMRRPPMACFNEVFKVVPNEARSSVCAKMLKLPRAAADELCVVAALAPVIATNLAVPFDDRIYATDASLKKGGIVSAPVSSSTSALLWRSADRVGKNVPMLSRPAAVVARDDQYFEYGLEGLHELEEDVCREENPAEDAEVPSRPLGLRYEFIELCGGSGVVSDEIVKLGVVCGPVIDISLSPQYDPTERRVIQWIIFMMEEDRLESFLVAPPCTTFSPACHPAVRSYANPRGFDPQLPNATWNYSCVCSLDLFICRTSSEQSRSW